MKQSAALYLRSSKDRSDVSIDAQRRALHELAMSRGFTIVQEFADAVESGKDEDRPAFQSLLRDLKNPKRTWGTLLALDTSRVARRREIALFFEKECTKFKVQLIYKSVPDTDPITEMLLKSVLQAMDEWHSLTSKAKGLAGMAENVKQGFRAGGRAPRGYTLEYISTGAIRDGVPVTKSKLVLNDEADDVRNYLELRATGLNRGRAIRELKLPWLTTSTHSLDWQALTYAGNTVWNVQTERIKGGTGEKRRPRSEWLITPDTHAALISDLQAEAILAQMERSIQGKRNRESNLLFSGLLESEDGIPWHSDGAGFYRLAKGKRVLASTVDSALMSAVRQDLKSDEATSTILKAMKAIDHQPVGNLQGLSTKIKNAAIKISKTIDLAAQVDDPAPVLRRVTDLEAQRNGWILERNELEEHLKKQKQSASINENDVRVMLDYYFEKLASAEIPALREAMKAMIDRVTLSPTTLSAQVHYALATGDNMASRRGVEPLLQP
jgi:site-specific DNA recombinase